MRKLLFATLPLLVTNTLAGCSTPGNPPSSWGERDGRAVRVHTLENENGLVLRVAEYGATITELWVPDREGRLADVVLGCDTLEEYVTSSPYFGCIAGRCANRIAGGSFILDGRVHQLAKNDGENHLHGGVQGFDKHVWSAARVDGGSGPAIRLTRVSPDGEEHYPGRLETTVTYTLTHTNELLVEIEAETDAPTLCNLVQHTYWNLAGHGSGPVTGHVLRLYAREYTPNGPTLVPTGERLPVAGTPFDFTTPKPIGADLAAAGGEPSGYDLNYVVDGVPLAMRPVARVVEPGSGRVLELAADQPGVQLYSGNFLDGTTPGKGGVRYAQYQGFCLETQRFPDAIHHGEWVSPVLRPGEVYRHSMRLRFGVE